MQLKMGGKFHLRLNNGKRPIANKYREGKMKRTLKRELKVREIVKRETIEASIFGWNSVRLGCYLLHSSLVHFPVQKVNISSTRRISFRGR